MLKISFEVFHKFFSYVINILIFIIEFITELIVTHSSIMTRRTIRRSRI